MAINIIDGFYLGTALPIDSRIVAENSGVRTSITHKYDGLRVFQLDTREGWTWNAGTLAWNLDGTGSISGSGTVSYVTKWSGYSGIGNSNIVSSGSNVGINVANPLAQLQVDGGTSQPFTVNLVSNPIIGSNWYYSGGDAVFNSGVGSVKIQLIGSSLLVGTRQASTTASSFINYFQVNNAGYNYIQAPTGNFISGPSVFSNSTTPYVTSQLVTLDGTFRFNSALYKKVVFLSFSTPGDWYKQVAFNVDGSVPSSTLISTGSTYTILSDEYDLYVNMSFSYGGANVNLPTLGSNSLESGREISISLESTYNTNYLVVGSSNAIIGLNGSTSGAISLSPGESATFVAYYQGNSTPKWKIKSWVKNTPVSETWKNIGSGGTMSNGQSVPMFAAGSFTNTGGSFTALQPISIRKTYDGYVEIRGIFMSSVTSSTTTIFTLPIGYRPLKDRRCVCVLINANTVIECFILSNGIVSLPVISSEFYSIEFRFEAGV